MTTRPHAVMFHHFHGPGYSKSQGSISADQLERIIEHYGVLHPDCGLISADDWCRYALSGCLLDEVCLSFDDGLRCQYDIALPVLEKHGLTAFWFVYTNGVMNRQGPEEVYRKFRNECFSSLDEFYNQFFGQVISMIGRDKIDSVFDSYDSVNWDDFPFYTDRDRRFRFLRDTVLGPNKYAFAMDRMMNNQGRKVDSFDDDIWLSQSDLRTLNDSGHIIGLHSHTHPMGIGSMTGQEQAGEYGANYAALLMAGIKPTTMAHPCNSYSEDTASILEQLGIEIGFRANMAEGFTGPYEYPREDCANLIRRLEPCQV